MLMAEVIAEGVKALAEGSTYLNGVAELKGNIVKFKEEAYKYAK